MPEVKDECQVVEVNSLNEFNKVLNENELVMVDFWAEWCGPCRMLHPVLDEVKKEALFRNRGLVIAKVNVDKAEEVAIHNNIRSIPTLRYFKNGELQKETVGLQSLDAIKEVINSIDDEGRRNPTVEDMQLS